MTGTAKVHEVGLAGNDSVYCFVVCRDQIMHFQVKYAEQKIILRVLMIL